MAPSTVPSHLAAEHGARELPSVLVDGYSLQVRDKDGFVGDQASQTAFRELLERWRRRRRRKGDDPLGRSHSRDLTKKQLDLVVAARQASEAGDIVQGAIEEFAQDLAYVIRRFLRQPSWQRVERIVIGGGFPESDVGERAILQAAAILEEMRIHVQIARLSHEVDDGGLIGWVHLAPPPMLAAHDAILAVDIGGTNIRAGVVELNLKKAKDLSKVSIFESELWRHGDEKINREDAVQGLIDMLNRLIERAEKSKLKLAPFIGIGCPGLIEPDGSIDRGAQNLPGNWESSRFNLPAKINEAIPTIGKEDTHVVMHNDAVVQGLSEVPFMQDVDSWGVFTIGTGLGNAHFVNRKGKDKEKSKNKD